MLHFIWFDILYQPLLNILIIFYNLLGHNMGLAIIALTLLVRVLLFPLSYKADKSRRILAELSPKLKELQKKHGHDKNQLAKAQMALYKQNKTNPLASCLPILLQFPILIAMYQVFSAGLAAKLTDLYGFVAKPEVINPSFFGINLGMPNLKVAFSTLPWFYWVLPILAGVTQYILSMMTLPPDKKSPEAAMARQMAYIFPIMTIFIALKLPSGLSLYWVVTTLFALAQQLIINKRVKLPEGPK